MSVPPTPNRSRGSISTDAARDRSLSVSAIQKAQRGSRRESVLPLCMSREQHAALHASPSASHSAGRQRKHRSSSTSTGKARQLTPPAASPLHTTTTTTASTANGWMALLAHPEASQEIARAVQMCSLYPTLRVAGTAFENSLNMAHRLSVESFTLLSSSRRGTEVNNGSFSAPNRDDAPLSPRMSMSALMETSTVLREATEEWRAFHDSGNGSFSPGRGGISSGHGRNGAIVPSPAGADAVSRTVALNGGTKMVQMACAMKRAAMWEVVVVTALAHRAMELKFRRDRLRGVLERHLLPTLLQRKKATGSVLTKRKSGAAAKRNNNNNSSMNKRDSNDASSGGGGGAAGPDGGAAPQGSYLRDHNAFFASLNSSALLQSFAETMTRHRFLPGELIARAGQPSQKSMYFLISGKCEVTRDRAEAGTDAVEGPESGAAVNTTPATPTYRDGMRATTAPRSRQRARLESSVSRCVKEVIMPGATFGGIFGGSATFAETYRALSQCIVWELRAEDFEQVFRPFSDRVMLDKYKECMRAHNLTWLQQHYQPAKVFGSIPVYRKLANRKSRYLSDFTPVVKVRGELLFAQGDLPGDVYCLLEGTVLRRIKGTTSSHGNGNHCGNNNGDNDNNSGSDDVAQRLATNAFSSLRAVGRFLLLGEEPHILPGVQPYSCTVSSRVALFYKISGERFVNALLDDPTLYTQLRERLLKQRQSNMVLRPECLAYVPLLQRFPLEKRAELVQYAEPRVVGRATSLCEPAQYLSELMLVVSGDVCDPRRYGVKPTRSLKVPASCDAEGNTEDSHNNNNTSSGNNTGARSLNGGDSFRGKIGKGDRHRRQTGVSIMNTSGTSEPDAAGPTKRRHLPLASTRASVAVRGGAAFFDDEDSDSAAGQTSSPDVVGVDWSFSLNESQIATTLGSGGEGAGANNATSNASFNCGNAGGGESSGGVSGAPRAHFAPPVTAAQQHQRLCETAALVYPDESEEINPPPPSQPSRTFLYALGGSWEALLLDKWPNGWETTSTVALWAIPTYKLRLVYNSCSKAAQSSILNGLRLFQKEDQRLPSIPHTKLPPMTVYTQRGEAATTVPGVPGSVESSSQSTTATRASLHRRPVRTQPAEQSSYPTRGPAASLPFDVSAEPTSSFDNGAGVSTAGDDEADPLGGHKKPQRPPKAKAATAGVVAVPSGAPKDAASPRQQPSPQKPPRTATTTPSTATTTPAKSNLPNIRKNKENTPRTKTEEGSAARSRTAVHGNTRCRGTGGIVGHRTRTAAAAAASVPPAPPTTTIDPAAKAAYDGVLDATDPLLLRIVRDPVVAPATGGAANARTPCAQRGAGRSLPPLTSSSGGTSSAAWPAQTPVLDRWFQAVPSYEPLPGTVRTADALAAPPVFSLNSTVLASAGIGSSSAHGKTLEKHVAYYAASVSPSAATSTTKRGDAAGAVLDGVSPPHPLPRRRAYAT